MAVSTGADLVGRDAELSVIADWLAGAEGGENVGREHVLAVEGEPGIGKTTLWAEVVRLARRRNWTVLDCRGRPSDVGLSHLGLTDLLRPVTDEAIGELHRHTVWQRDQLRRGWRCRVHRDRLRQHHVRAVRR